MEPGAGCRDRVGPPPPGTHLTGVKGLTRPATKRRRLLLRTYKASAVQGDNFPYCTTAGGKPSLRGRPRPNGGEVVSDQEPSASRPRHMDVDPRGGPVYSWEVVHETRGLLSSQAFTSEATVLQLLAHDRRVPQQGNRDALRRAGKRDLCGDAEGAGQPTIMTLIVRESLNTAEPDEVTELYYGIFESKLCLSGARTGGQFRHTRHDAGSFWMKRLQAPSVTRFTAEPMRRLHLVTTRSGLYTRHLAGGDEVVAPGQFYLIPPGTSLDLTTQDVDFETLSLDPSLFIEEEGDSQLPQFTGSRPISTPTARMLHSTLHYLRTVVFADPEIVATPLAVAGAGRLLAAITIEAFPHQTIETRIGDNQDAHPAALRRAIVYMEANASTDIGLAEIATAARITGRAVQLAFGRHLSTTPMAYLRRIRLAGAHQDLLAARPEDGSTVAAIAARWGFSHLGRFAAEYRNAYGRNPGNTLRG